MPWIYRMWREAIFIRSLRSTRKHAIFNLTNISLNWVCNSRDAASSERKFNRKTSVIKEWKSNYDCVSGFFIYFDPQTTQGSRATPAREWSINKNNDNEKRRLMNKWNSGYQITMSQTSPKITETNFTPCFSQLSREVTICLEIAIVHNNLQRTLEEKNGIGISMVSLLFFVGKYQLFKSHHIRI